MFGVGLRADQHMLAGDHRHGASHQSRDTRDRESFCVAAAAATPTIKIAVEIMPSLVPSTDALNHRCGQRGGSPGAGEDDSSDTLPVRSNPTRENQYDEDDQDDTDHTDSTMTVSVTVTAEAATEATKQENNEDDNEDGSERHGLHPMAGPN